MTRRSFLKLLSILGVGASSGCNSSPNVTSGSFSGNVIVVGAGAAGMSAAHFLVRAGADVTVLEAGATHGGRIKTAREFVDFPIPLGGEWLHTEVSELAELTGREAPGIEMASYGETEQYGIWRDGVYTVSEVEASTDLKFVGRTWLDVFDEFLLPLITDRIQFNSVVSHIDYSGQKIVLTTEDGTTFDADRVIVTAPIVQLRDHIVFTPELPQNHRTALNNANVWGGFKAFIEFSERFYPGALEIDGRAGTDGQHLYYDASYGQNSLSHVLGLFSVGTGAEAYQKAYARNGLIEFILSELDPIFDGKPSKTYVQHIAQDWNREPHIGMAYLADNADWPIPRQLATSIDNRLFLAGDAYVKDNNNGSWSEVHLAARAGRVAVDQILT